jgi:hypothetical protein
MKGFPINGNNQNKLENIIVILMRSTILPEHASSIFPRRCGHHNDHHTSSSGGYETCSETCRQPVERYANMAILYGRNTHNHTKENQLHYFFS